MMSNDMKEEFNKIVEPFGTRPEEYKKEKYEGTPIAKDEIVDSLRGYRYGVPMKTGKLQNRLVVGIPMTGLLRAEWVLARYGQIIPCNWSQSDSIQFIDQMSPLGFLVADARNIVANQAVDQGFEWLMFIDHDVILPPDFLVRFNERCIQDPVPVWSGLYFTKSIPSEPLIYRGIGQGYYADWTFGDLVWVDVLPMGCTVIHHSILKVMYDEAETYTIAGRTMKKIFDTPNKVWYDPEKTAWLTAVGTEDLKFCNDVVKQNVFEKAGWTKYAEMEHPFLIDTNIFCKHIMENGTQFPARGEETQFIKKVSNEK
jgi:hypothetical protein